MAGAALLAVALTMAAILWSVRDAGPVGSRDDDGQAGTGGTGSTGGTSARCGAAGRTVTVAAAPAVAPVVRTALRAADCEVRLRAADPAAVGDRVGRGARGPDLWIPDSTTWVARTGTGADAPEVLVDSLARSPVVLVAADRPPPTSWEAALADPGLLLGDPARSTTALTPVLASVLLGGADDGAGARIAPLAQEQAGSATVPDDRERLARLATSGSGVTTVSEQVALDAPAELRAAVPDAGTVYLDYPLLLTAADGRRGEVSAAAEEIASVLSSRRTRRSFARAGLRPADGSPDGPAGVSGASRGVGAVTELATPRRQVRSVLRAWSALSVPTRALAVVDVSGSMDSDAGGRSRIALTAAATQRGLSLFPDTAQIGLWAFSQDLVGTVDHQVLVPIRSLAASVGDGDQRAALETGLLSLPARTGDGTGLHATTLAAYRAVVQSWDPSAVNSVLLITDGVNEDAGGPDLATTLRRLRGLVDPDRPVRIVAIGISADADARALRVLADATGGQSYVAREPEDMARVFGQALASRPE